MLSQMQRLQTIAEGRYASDEELRFLPDYLRSYELRLQTYQQIQKSEAAILKQVFSDVVQQAPEIFPSDRAEQLKHCQQDVLHTLRYCAATLLTDDLDLMRERYVLWLQTVVRAFEKQESNQLIFTAMQKAVAQILPPVQAALLVPLLQEVQAMVAP
ncbi:MAG: hypothetical protein RLZZ511_634 [Cyanobacteriota bacterium]|jgi:Phycobilisome protein